MDNSHKKYVAEMIGTAVLVLFGCGSAVLAGSEVGFLGISFAFGLSVVIMAYTIGGISGCHINPAVTIGMMVSDKISKDDGIKYIIYQCIGGVLGAAILYYIALSGGIDVATSGLGQNGFGEHSPGGYGKLTAVCTEIVMTAVFVFVILGTTNNKGTGANAGLVIGLALVVIHIVSIPVTGTSVNPARSIGPALFVGGEAIEQLWVFIASPIVGGALGALLWKKIAPEAKKPAKKAAKKKK